MNPAPMRDPDEGKDRGGSPVGDLAGSRLDRRGRLVLQLQQARSILRMTPWTVSLNIVAAALVLALGHDALPEGPLLAWAGAGVLLSAVILGHWYLVTRRCTSRMCTAGYVRATLLQGLLLGVLWALLPLFFFAPAGPDLRILIATLAIGAFSLGALRLAQVPLAAAAYVVLPASALAWTAWRHMTPPVGLATAVMLGVYALAVMLVVWMRYREAIIAIRDHLELQRREHIIRLLLDEFAENASDWLWEADTDGRLHHATQRLEELSGHPLAELVGRPLHAVLGADGEERAWRKFHRRLKEGDSINGMVLPAVVHGQRRWYSISARPLRYGGGNVVGYRGVAGDITAQVLHERRLREEKENAKREARARADFLALISHELRTPLNALVGFSELLVKEAAGPLAADYREYARHITLGAQQLSRLIGDILDYTRFERNKLRLMEQEVDLVEIAEMALRQAARDERAQGLDLRLESSFEELPVRGDGTRLRQVLDNLLTNAVKFTDEGEVVLRLRRLADGGVRVEVADTGRGIDPDKAETLFEPFRQADGTLTRCHDGIGLGLPISRSLIRLHGGDLWLEERAAGGCRACFTLPPRRIVDPLPGEAARAAA